MRQRGPGSLPAQPPPHARPRLTYPALISAALIVGAMLRLIANDAPFVSSDHAELAAIVTFFYPRGPGSFIDQPPVIWQMLTSVHGILPPALGMASMTLVGLAGITITEWWWNLPFVLAGLATILLGARFAEELAGRRAGAIAAVLLAVLPIHAVTTRASGLGHITLMGLCQLVTLRAFVRYYEQPTPAHARRASLALCVALLVELFFPVLLALLFAVGMLCGPAESSLRARLAATRRLFTSRAVLLAPLLLICANGLMMVAYAAGYLPQGGTFSRLFQGSDRQPGLFLGAFWANGSVMAGSVGFALLVVLGALGLPALLRLDRRAVPLLWACAYLLPFMIFTRANFVGYLLMGGVGLVINAAIMLGALWGRGRAPRLLVGLLMPALAAAMALQSIAIIFGVGPLAGGSIAQGGVSADQGLKAAAWWVRSSTSTQDLIFADSRFEPYQLWYYLRRPMIALTDAERPEDAYVALAKSPARPKLYLLPPERADMLLAYAEGDPQILLTITDHERPVLMIYGYGRDGPPARIEVAEGNQRFDRDLGGFRAMFSLHGAQ
ncbi:hypothetical protein K2Z83_15040 [Oscillochloris sp. ZM17-4]|uniref:hypothetical protein n=1 Tax=Oscillochloris sp. ZM17-4 TaxID=2866714 RepID=UPI001C72B89E|nr:hypothetical protein [Oscillochloris sp. ZM17-4]MBX0328992.1 hypothetical protein [Oscillochloris sp. ZM17-4]